MSTVNLCVCVCVCVFSAFAQHNCILRLNDKISLDICMCVCVRACACIHIVRQIPMQSSATQVNQRTTTPTEHLQRTQNPGPSH